MFSLVLQDKEGPAGGMRYREEVADRDPRKRLLGWALEVSTAEVLGEGRV